MSPPSLSLIKDFSKPTSVGNLSPVLIMENPISPQTISDGSSLTALSNEPSDSDIELPSVKSGLTTPDWELEQSQKFGNAKNQDSQPAKLNNSTILKNKSAVGGVVATTTSQLDPASRPRGNFKRKRDACFDPVMAAQLESEEESPRQLRSSASNLFATRAKNKSTPVKPAKSVVIVADEDQKSLDDGEDYHYIDNRFAKGVCKKIDGVWKAPMKCQPCQSKGILCDRVVPCNSCESVGAVDDCIRKHERLRAIPGQPDIKNDLAHTANNAMESFEIGTPVPKKNKTTKQPAKTRQGGRTRKPTQKVEFSPEPPINNSTTKGGKNKTQPGKAARKPKVPAVVPVDNRPLCRERPRVWSTTRQELCETLPYYRAYQGGNYHKGGIMFSFLLDGFVHERDHLGNTCVITHPGGGTELDESGNRVLKDDHKMTDNRIKATINNLRDKIPVVLLAGENNPLLPAKIGCRYAVLDWFRVTHIWPELEPNGKIRFKFRFEKLKFDESSWWTPADSKTPTMEDTVSIEYDTCSLCEKSSPYIYDGEWMCLKKDCEYFWKVIGEDGFMRPPSEFRFRETFLNGRDSKHLEFFSQPPSDLVPLEPSQRYDTFPGDGQDVSRAAWKGFCCPKCGKLNCREFWGKWVCTTWTGGCGYEVAAPRVIYDATYLSGPHAAQFTGPAIPANLRCPLVRMTQRILPGNLRAMTYYLGDMGTVTHILANRTVNAGERDADWMLEQYQAPEMPFRRNKMDNGKVVGGMLSQHFTFNSGEPYKYIIKVDSTPFHKSPEVVQRALELIHERVRMVQHDVHFNEILSVGYFEDQKMEWHDDGEKELGGTVASISLGAPAKMKFQVKKKYVPQVDTILQPSVSVSDADEEEDDFDEAFEEWPKKLSRGSNGIELLDLTLRHGDVVVMNGREIQKYCEHIVIPTGLFRVAATARFIHNDPNSQAK